MPKPDSIEILSINRKLCRGSVTLAILYNHVTQLCTRCVASEFICDKLKFQYHVDIVLIAVAAVAQGAGRPDSKISAEQGNILCGGGVFYQKIFVNVGIVESRPKK